MRVPVLKFGVHEALRHTSRCALESLQCLVVAPIEVKRLGLQLKLREVSPERLPRVADSRAYKRAGRLFLVDEAEESQSLARV